jgi:Cof subfamily protein (haloacid dehalogenase superfamily)
MDGTLLDSQDRISGENEAALKKLQQNGTEVIIASGRLDLLVKRYVRQLDLKGHVISCNGGLIRDIETNKIVYANVMNKAAVKKIITYCMENKNHFMIYTADIIYSNQDNPRAEKYEKMNQSMAEDLRFPVEYIENCSIERLLERDILKVLLICDTKEQLHKIQNVFSIYKDLTVVSSASGLLDIMASNTSKGRALKILADKLQVNLKHAIAFGDNYNDIEMLREVGMPIAMENSVPQLKKEAKYVTKSNNESGIAYAINHLI